MKLRIRKLFQRYINKLPCPQKYNVMYHTSGINSRFNGSNISSFIGNSDLIKRTTALAKIAGIDMDYVDDVYTTVIVFNKILSGTATEEWIRTKLDHETYEEGKHRFYGVYVPMYMKEKFSINAIKAMQRCVIDQLGLTDEDRIDINIETYLKPKDIDLWNIYYNKEKNITVVITDGGQEPISFRNIKFAKVLYNEYLFNGTEIPDEIIDYLDDALVMPTNCDTSNSVFCDGTLFNVENLEQLNLNEETTKTLLAQEKLLEYAYKLNPDIIDTMRKEEIKISLERYVHNKISSLSNRINSLMNEYKRYQEQASQAYQSYLVANDDLNNYNNKKDTMMNDLFNNIDTLCTKSREYESITFEDVNDTFGNAPELEFTVCGPVQGIDMDDLDILKRNWRQSKPQFYEEVLTLIEGNTPYRLYFGQKVYLGLDNMRPSYHQNEYSTRDINTMPNPHLYYYNCWGNTPDTLRRLNDNNDLATVLAVFLKASLSLNVRDNTVVNRMIDNFGIGEMFHSRYNSVINMETGELMTFKQYLDIVKSSSDDTDNDDNDDL